MTNITGFSSLQRLLVTTALPLCLMAACVLPGYAGSVSVTGANGGQAALPNSPQSQKWRLQILPNAGGASQPYSMNNRNWVSGFVNLPGNQVAHPGLWRRTQDGESGNQSWRLTDLGTLGGANAAIYSPNKNEIGWLAGLSETAAPDPNSENWCGFICNTSSCAPTHHLCQGFLWQEQTKKMIALPALTTGCNSQVTNIGCNSIAQAANNNRQIAGFAENGVMSQNCATPQVFLFEGVVWSLDPSGAPVIERRLRPYTGDSVSLVGDLNDAGIVVGQSGACASPNGYASPSRAVLWDKNGVPHVLGAGTLGGSYAGAFPINQQGQVVGPSTLAGDIVLHAFLWEGGPMKDLGSLRPEDTAVFPQSISNRGEVVGQSCGPNEPTPNANGCAAFYWRKGVMIDLNAHLTKPTSLQIADGTDITESGEIAVFAFDPIGGTFMAAVLVPEEDEQGGWQNSQSQSAATYQRSALPNSLAQRFSPQSLRGWRIAH
jgi:probable HAF family extracellular repeat protein